MMVARDSKGRFTKAMAPPMSGMMRGVVDIAVASLIFGIISNSLFEIRIKDKIKELKKKGKMKKAKKLKKVLKKIRKKDSPGDDR